MRSGTGSHDGQDAGGSSDDASTIPTTTAWRDRRAGLFSIAQLAVMRAIRNPWLLSVVALGVIIVDILVCTVPLYTKLVSDIQLRNTISSSPAPQRNMLVYAHSDASNAAIHRWIADKVEAQAQQDLAAFSTRTPMRYLTGDTMALAQAGSYTPAILGELQNVELETFDYGAMLPHMHLIEGKLPQTGATGQPAQVMITQEMADAWHLRIGQRISIAQKWDFSSTHQTTIPVVITGVWTPISENDPFWNGLSFRSTSYLIKYPNQKYPPPLWPLLTTEESLYATLGTIHGMGVTQNWVYYADPARITTASMATITGDLMSFRTQLASSLEGTSQSVQVGTRGRLDQIIQGVQQQLNLLTLPLYMIAAQIVGLVLLFVATMAALLINAQEQEIATLKSRGASSPQLLGVFTAQSVPLGLLATVSGPVLGVGLALLQVRWFLPGGGGDITNISHPAQVVMPAVIGSTLGSVVVISSGLSAARLNVLAFRREMARPTQKPFWQRYHLDLGLAALCVVGYLELSQFGDIHTRLQLGARSNSLLLLITPALLLIAGGLLLLRLIPLVSALGARIADRGRGIASVLAFAQIQRTPRRYARMTLLLALAVGLGLFALIFDASLAQNVHDRIAYATGADIRLDVDSVVSVQEADRYSAHLRTLSGVAAVSDIYRTTGETLFDQGQQGVDMLGIDASTFADVAGSSSWRPDYASQSLPDLMSQMEAHRVAAEAGSPSHPIWVIVSGTLAQHLRLKAGDHFRVTISDIGITPTNFVVGAVVSQFPTLYPHAAPGGFIILDLRDLNATITAHSPIGAGASVNEFWLRTSGDLAKDQALIQTLNHQQVNFALRAVHSLREEVARAEVNPVNGGMRGLLLIGAIVAALLAVLGSLVQAVMAARQRTTQFAVLRTLGMASRQLTGVLLSEQLVVYLFGLIGGTALGLILITATSPFLQFSDSLVDPNTVGIPSYLLRINWTTAGIFYGTLLAAFVLALVITARYAATIGLGRALRIGKD